MFQACARLRVVTKAFVFLASMETPGLQETQMLRRMGRELKGDWQGPPSRTLWAMVNYPVLYPPVNGNTLKHFKQSSSSTWFSIGSPRSFSRKCYGDWTPRRKWISLFSVTPARSEGEGPPVGQVCRKSGRCSSIQSLPVLEGLRCLHTPMKHTQHLWTVSKPEWPLTYTTLPGEQGQHQQW